MSTKIIHGECVATMAGMEPESFHAVVTDPPAGISFMNRAWDHDKGGRDEWIAWMQTVATEALRVCKPGAHALVWALPRTSHWTAMAWENAGWVVRDRLAHLFASGFPKSLDVSKALDRAVGAEREVVGIKTRPDGTTRPNAGSWTPGTSQIYAQDKWTRKHMGIGSNKVDIPVTDAARQWEGWGTALKPACEDWWVLRKPLSEPTVAANVFKHGTGGLNIDACRVGVSKDVPASSSSNKHVYSGNWGADRDGTSGFDQNIGRWPANVIHDGSPEVMDAFAKFGSTQSVASDNRNGSDQGSVFSFDRKQDQLRGHTDSGTAARFFFTAKAASWEREGSHPTVKPQALMEWLLSLVTPPGGRVLDPFCGTGSTLVAADFLGFDAVGIEQDAKTCADAENKIKRMPARRMLGDDAKPAKVAEGQLGLFE